MWRHYAYYVAHCRRRDSFLKFVYGVVGFFNCVVLAETKPYAAVRHFDRHAHRKQNVRRVKAAAAARRTAADGNSVEVHQHQDAFALYVLETEVCHRRHAMFKVAVKLDVGNFIHYAFHKVVAHFGYVLVVFVHLLDSHRQCLCHAYNRGRVCRAAALGAFLSAAGNKFFQFHAVADVQCADALRSVKLVTAHAYHVCAKFLHVDVNVGHCLHAVGVEQCAVSMRYFAKLAHGLDCANLVVDVHDGHNACLVVDYLFQFRRVNYAVGSDNWALKGAALAAREHGKGTHVIISAIEHHAILHTCEYLEKHGCEVTYLPVDENGMVTAEQVKNAIRDNTVLVSVMFANNEVGTIMPIAEIGKVCKEKGVFFHTDAVQAVGHLPIDVKAQNIDMLSMSGHKFHGPKGIGALYIRKGINLPNLIEGGAQERNRRAGTENIPGIVGMAAALTEAVNNMEKTA